MFVLIASLPKCRMERHSVVYQRLCWKRNRFLLKTSEKQGGWSLSGLQMLWFWPPQKKGFWNIGQPLTPNTRTDIYRSGWCISTSFLGAKIKLKYPGYMCCHLALVTSLETRVCTLVIRCGAIVLAFSGLNTELFTGLNEDILNPFSSLKWSFTTRLNIKMIILWLCWCEFINTNSSAW